ncbi:ATP-binding protein [Bacillus atrophaeus]|uniref:ATP-binding protein n=1 Tax=Bacillus atrophaeus TaxID=1452 RepID=UPI00240DC328|nr:ATP-binding protein [Bacillus atrophaeus]
MPEIELDIPKEEIIKTIGNVTSPFVVLSELVKNGVDANAKTVTIKINTEESTIKIIDDGDGFNLKDIKKLGTATHSNKKRESYLKNKQGNMLLGSKGLAIFSIFSLGEKLVIKTKNKVEKCYEIVWERNNGNPSYRELSDTNMNYGTEITISMIDNTNMLLLQSEKELSKFKHISLRNFDPSLKLPKIFIVKDEEKINIEVDNIVTLEDLFDAKIVFKYSEEHNALKFQYLSKDQRVNSDEIIFDLNQYLDIDKIIFEKYHFHTEKFAFRNYLTGGLIEKNELLIPNFEGTWYVKANRKPKELLNFESGIKLYVNNFALYNYINTNNDWLQITNISQNKKANIYKQHNVFGFLNFPEFNEHEEGLKISNERGGFIEDTYFRKFLDILYQFVLYTAINIDIAIKNNKFLIESEKQFIGKGSGQETGKGSGQETGKGSGQETGKGSGQETGKGSGQETGKGSGQETGKGSGQETGKGSGQETGKGSGQETGKGSGQETGKGSGQETGKGSGQETGKGSGQETGKGSGQGSDQESNKDQETVILKYNNLDIYSGMQLYLKDPTLVKLEKTNELIIVPRTKMNIEQDIVMADNTAGLYNIDFFYGKYKETLELKIRKRRIIGRGIKKVGFFESSDHFVGDIDLRDISNLVKQLIGLNYEEKYLLYVISFRAIIEDVVKKYLHLSNIPLKGNLKDNLIAMLLDLQVKLKIVKNDPLTKEKQNILQKFKGRDSFNNFIVSVKIKFEQDDYDKFLHSLTHNPVKIREESALEIANNLILPLYTLLNLLDKKNIL